MPTARDCTLHFIIGTEAEIMKLFPVINRAKEAGFQCNIIATGQNNIHESRYLALTGETVSIDICKNHPGDIKTTGKYLQWFLGTAKYGKKVLKPYFKTMNRASNLVVVHADTLTTVQAAWLAKKCKMPYIHIESGERSFNFLSPFPEEFDRLFGSLNSVINFCSKKEFADYAAKRFKGESVNTEYNTGIETLYHAIDLNRDQPHPEQPQNPYFMFMLHRQENLMSKKFMANTCQKILELADHMPCVFIYHVQTKKAMEKVGVFEELINHPNITAMLRQPYEDFIKLVSNSSFIITDGCGNQQEFFYLGKPYLIMRTHVEENSEGLGHNAKPFAGDYSNITHFRTEHKKFIQKPITPHLWPSEIIIQKLLDYFLTYQPES